MTDAERNLGEIQSHLIGGLPAEPLETYVHHTPVLCLPPGWSRHEQAHLLTDPLRIDRQQVFNDLVSWLEYVNRFKDAWSVVFIPSGAFQFKVTAQLDYHGPSAPHWCSHTAEFVTRATPAWSAWSGANETQMKQSEFSDFLYQNQKEIVNPAGAELLEIIQTLKATSAGEFREMRDDFSGSSELIYRMKISSQGGTSEKPLNLPNQFQVAVVPFYGCPAMVLQADLRVRAPTKDGDPLLLGFRFYRLTDQLQMLTDAISKLIAESTSLPVWR
jgi:uncharacterized protein YfdQ (DUF2303 family)